MRKLCVSEWVASAGLAPASPVCTHPSGSLLTLGRPRPAAPCTARTPRRFTRPTRWLLPAVGFLKCAHICPRSKRESARLPVACALGRLLGTHTLPLTLPHLTIAGGASAGSSSCSASPMEAPKVRLALIARWLARTFPPPFPNCSDEPSTYLDSRHDTSVADSSRSLGCGSEQLPPPLHPPTKPSPSCPCPGEGMTT